MAIIPRPRDIKATYGDVERLSCLDDGRVGGQGCIDGVCGDVVPLDAAGEHEGGQQCIEGDLHVVLDLVGVAHYQNLVASCVSIRIPSSRPRRPRRSAPPGGHQPPHRRGKNPTARLVVRHISDIGGLRLALGAAQAAGHLFAEFIKL